MSPNKCLGKLKRPEIQWGPKWQYIYRLCLLYILNVRRLIRSLRRPDKTMVKKKKYNKSNNGPQNTQQETKDWANNTKLTKIRGWTMILCKKWTWALMYLCVRGKYFASFYNFGPWFWFVPAVLYFFLFISFFCDTKHVWIYQRLSYTDVT
jgi:hypothetical protein